MTTRNRFAFASALAALVATGGCGDSAPVAPSVPSIAGRYFASLQLSPSCGPATGFTPGTRWDLLADLEQSGATVTVRMVPSALGECLRTGDARTSGRLTGQRLNLNLQYSDFAVSCGVVVEEAVSVTGTFEAAVDARGTQGRFPGTITFSSPLLRTLNQCVAPDHFFVLNR